MGFFSKIFKGIKKGVGRIAKGAMGALGGLASGNPIAAITGAIGGLTSSGDSEGVGDHLIKSGVGALKDAYNASENKGPMQGPPAPGGGRPSNGLNDMMPLAIAAGGAFFLLRK